MRDEPEDGCEGGRAGCREVEHQQLTHAHVFVHLKWRQEKRERRKTDLVDITCNEETINADADQDEPDLVKLGSKTISNKEKTSLYRSVAERLAGRGYEIRNPKGIKRMWNLLFSDYMQSKDVLTE